MFRAVTHKNSNRSSYPLTLALGSHKSSIPSSFCSRERVWTTKWTERNNRQDIALSIKAKSIKLRAWSLSHSVGCVWRTLSTSSPPRRDLSILARNPLLPFVCGWLSISNQQSLLIIFNDSWIIALVGLIQVSLVYVCMSVRVHCTIQSWLREKASYVFQVFKIEGWFSYTVPILSARCQTQPSLQTAICLFLFKNKNFVSTKNSINKKSQKEQNQIFCIPN